MYLQLLPCSLATAKFDVTKSVHTSIMNELLQDDNFLSAQAMRDHSDKEVTPNENIPIKSGIEEMSKEGKGGERSGDNGESGESSDEGTAVGKHEAEDNKSARGMHDDKMKSKGHIQEQSTSGSMESPPGSTSSQSATTTFDSPDVVIQSGKTLIYSGM